MGGNSGSTIQARVELTSHLFLVILVVVVIVVVFACIYIISKAISNYLKSPAYIEKQKSRPTTLKDMNEIAAACNLVKEEKEVLWQLCKLHKTPNIRYLIRESEEIDYCMKEVFDMLNVAGNEVQKSYLFSMRKKIFTVFSSQFVIKNSKLIDADTVFTYTVKKGFHHKLKLKQNGIDGLILSLPPTLTDEDEMPKSLEKITLIFETKNGTFFSLESRVVRFQESSEGEKQVFITHSDKITPLQKREQERAEVDFPCKFNSVKVIVEKKGKKEEISYVPGEKNHDGRIEDISAGGCRLVTNLPIKSEQYINIEGTLNGKQTDKAIGIIVRTTKRSDNVYILHIRFLKIDLPVVNRIQAMVSHYD